MTSCSDFQFVSFPSISKFTTLDSGDFAKLKTVYSKLYDTVAADNIHDQNIRSIRVFKTITFFNQRLGSLRNPITKNSCFIMASWAEEDGEINLASAVKLRPGKVLYYFTHSYMIDGQYKEHLFACVYWYAKHTCRFLYGKPLEIWKDAFVPEGPAMFLPIHRLECRCTFAYSTIPLPDSTHERVIFSSPFPGLKYS